MNTYLREATIDDAETILEWRNVPLTREHSFSKDVIDFDAHMKWFGSKLLDKKCYIYILMNESGPAGQLRIDKVDEMGEISYMVAPDKRNRGFGKRIVELAESVVTQDMKALIGLVENQNEFSKKCFRVNNYSEFPGGQVTFFVKIL